MIKRLIQRAAHLGERVVKESKVFPKHRKNFGLSTAFSAWWDGLIPPGKSEKYIQKTERFVDASMLELTKEYAQKSTDELGCLPDTNQQKTKMEKIPVWCCWWQGEAHMPELVKMCNRRLKQMIPEKDAQLFIITLDNYRDYVEIPEHILRKYEEKKITMTTLSDILRFRLLSTYGGFWIDSTVYISGSIPEKFFGNKYYSQKMKNTWDWKREACKGRWCGFLMAGPAHHIIFEYMNDAFSLWWKKYDDIVDYVLIDYLLLTGYKYVPAIKEAIDQVEANNEQVFRMYGRLNEGYTETLYRNLTEDTVFHKLTYKMDLHKKTDQGQETLYQHMLNEAGMNRDER